MARVGRVLVIQLMARITARERQLIIIRDMASLAQCRRVFPGEWEIRDRMVELRAGPARRRMARLASMAEIPRDVAWVCRPLKIVLMALETAREC